MRSEGSKPLCKRVYALLLKHPDSTELELTRRIYGKDSLYSRVNPICRKLIEKGLVVREGRGWVGDPYRYRPV